MIRFSQLVGLLAAAMLPYFASASDPSLTVIACKNQELTYQKGVPFVVSSGPNSTVIASFEHIDRKRLWVSLSVANYGKARVTVSDSNIFVATYSDAGEMQAKVIPASQVVAKEERRQTWQRLGTALAAGLNSYSAAQQGQYTQQGSYSGTGSAYNYDQGRTNYNYGGTFTISGYDPAVRSQALQNANAQNMNMMANLTAQQAERMANLTEELFQSQTIDPGSGYSGRVQIERPSAVRGKSHIMTVGVGVDDELHTFTLLSDYVPGTEASEKLASAAGVEIYSDGELYAYSPAAFHPVEVAPEAVPSADDPIPEPSNAPQPDAAPDSDSAALGSGTATAMATPDENATLEASLIGLSISSKRDAAGAVKTHVLLDLQWTIPATAQGRMVGGLLTLREQSKDKQISFPWFLAPEQTSGSSTYEELAAEVDISNFPDAITWIKTADLASTTVEFDQTQIR